MDPSAVGDISNAYMCRSAGCEPQGVTLQGSHCRRALAGSEVALLVTARTNQG